MSRFICVIPARMGSSRFPGKPMAQLLGLPMILHIWHRCSLVKAFEQIIVATCDQEIYDCVKTAGGKVIMTSHNHERCTDRVTEAINTINLGLSDKDFVVMVQGDEILVNPDMLLGLIQSCDSNLSYANNLISRIHEMKDFEDSNVVKVVTDINDRIIFLSRSPIPNITRNQNIALYQQTGIIAYRPSFLDKFSSLKQTPLEVAESIDMLRLIENNLELKSTKTDIATIGVDTPADLETGKKALSIDPWTQVYWKNFN